ncbi:hypothetical protein MTR_6g079095 [Medicago truncatula]|uniref:Uncharacterized protein n=1 Tax=Medicago truncatula TaxID=3880 RepID=A0A072UM48_MEDTR|nr:hypothetical protein MTR_6g079095 [Medicago truncatula]
MPTKENLVDRRLLPLIKEEVSGYAIVVKICMSKEGSNFMLSLTQISTSLNMSDTLKKLITPIMKDCYPIHPNQSDLRWFPQRSVTKAFLLPALRNKPISRKATT